MTGRHEDRFDLGPAILFCPADRPERYPKAAGRADAVILDLEDAVLPADRADARWALLANPQDPARTIVRVNPVGTEDFARDLACLAESEYRYVMLAKTEAPEQVRALADYRVVALCETALGVVNAPALAAEANVVALMWGAEDLVASLGGTASRHDAATGATGLGPYRSVPLQARAQVRLAAAAYGKAAIDSVYLDLQDTAGLTAEVSDAVAQGFTATACIHPGQVTVIRDGYAPTPEQLQWARGLLAEAETQTGAFRYEGQMVDEVVLKKARLLAARGRLDP
ncbi:CoA ester lyase [Zhihengliuella sp.]|uniref:HpcH/HpaI aldolase/citrate lyase family protein n=1 Tax=Zhihengliuella sp. TaxID=1954483 RepID=UPI002811078C|nr:CoA ester lyase [Zhihengliuella sp.]